MTEPSLGWAGERVVDRAARVLVADITIAVRKRFTTDVSGRGDEWILDHDAGSPDVLATASPTPGRLAGQLRPAG